MFHTKKTKGRIVRPPHFLFFLIFSLSLGSLFLGCRAKSTEEKAPVVRPVKIHTIGSLEPSAVREYPGTIRAFQTAEMGFEVPGRVTEFLVQESDAVEQGQVLARLDARDYDAQAKAAMAVVQKARADLERNRNINTKSPGAISESEIDVTRRALQVAEAQLEIAEKAVGDAELRAPFAGVIARKLVEDFANVAAKEPVLILQDTSLLEIEVAVPERDFVEREYSPETKEDATKRLAPTIIVSALQNREFPAKIKEYATRADPVTRTFAVKLNFDNPEEFNILPGMTARARVVVDPDRAWSVPVTAVQADENKQSYVWRVDPQSMKVSQARVEVGNLTGDRILLTDGVDEGDRVAISGVTALRESMQVREYESQNAGASTP